jgi:hypothetical protein
VAVEPPTLLPPVPEPAAPLGGAGVSGRAHPTTIRPTRALTNVRRETIDSLIV